MNAFSFSFPVQFSPHWFSFPLRTSANETLREITLNIYFWAIVPAGSTINIIM